jgi:hypothetical protein
MAIEAYPLSWPAAWPRTPAAQRAYPRFNRVERVQSTLTPGSSYPRKRELSVYDAVSRVHSELAKFGVESHTIIISTNVETRRDGTPRSDRRTPDDPGVAVYWADPDSGAQQCMAIDLYTSVAGNLAAVAATIDAMRAIERHGGAQILKRAFEGFKALPSSTVTALSARCRARRRAPGRAFGVSEEIIAKMDLPCTFRRRAPEVHLGPGRRSAQRRADPDADRARRGGPRDARNPHHRSALQGRRPHQQASGTTDPVVRAEDQAHAARAVRGRPPRHSARRARRPRLVPRGVRRVRRRALHELPIGDTMPLLATAMEAWIEGATKEYSTNISATSRRRGALSSDTIRRRASPICRGARRAAEDVYGAKHPRSFNLARGRARRSCARRSSDRTRSTSQVAAVEPRKVKKRAAWQGVLSIDEMRERFPHPGDRQGRRDRVEHGHHGHEPEGVLGPLANAVRPRARRRHEARRPRARHSAGARAGGAAAVTRSLAARLSRAHRRRVHADTSCAARTRSGWSSPASRARGAGSTWATARRTSPTSTRRTR